MGVMPRFQRHIFICTNRRDASDPKGCCSAKGSEEVRALFKSSLKARGLNRVVRANASGCLDACATGTTVVVYPEAVWYGGVTAADVEEIIERHVIGGEVVERLQVKGLAGESRHQPLVVPPAPVRQEGKA